MKKNYTTAERELVCRRNDSSDEAIQMCGGRLFHARAAASGNAWLPMWGYTIPAYSGNL